MMSNRFNVRHKYQWEYWYYPGGGTTSSSHLLADYYDLFYVLNAGQTHGNRKDPGNQSFIKYYYDPYHGQVISGQGPGTTRVQTGPFPLIVPNSTYDWDNNLYNEVLSKVQDRIRARIDLSVNIAESKQSKAMFRDAGKLLSYVYRFRPSDLKKWYREFRRQPAANRVGSKWLEFQYGWKPLASDLYESVVELAISRPHYMKVKERGKSERVKVMIGEGTGYDEATAFHKNRVLICCEYTLPTSDAQLLSNFTGLNPLGLAWELTPYSFVVDWFLDVGGYLRSFETSMLTSSNFLRGYVTETYVDSSYGVDKHYKEYAPSYFDLVDLVGSSRVAAKRRTVLSSNPFPRTPSFKADLGSGRLLNAAALLSQFLRK